MTRVFAKKTPRLVVVALAILAGISSPGFAQNDSERKTVQFGDSELNSDASSAGTKGTRPGYEFDRFTVQFGDSEKSPVDEPGESTVVMPAYTAGRPVQNEQTNPLQLASEIAEEMLAHQNEESSKLDAIRKGLQTLQDRNQILETLTKQRSDELEAAYKKAAQAQRVAEDARRTAEKSNDVTMEAMRQLLSIQERSRLEQPVPALPVSDLPPPDPAEAGGEAVLPIASRKPPIPISRGIVNTQAPVSPTPTVTPSFRSVPVFDQAIDREKFADNLFGAGEFETAVAIYAELLKSQSGGADEIWFQYQLASCYRNLGKFEQAEKLYRMVASEKESFLAPTARWWLSMIEDQRSVSQAIGNLNTALTESSTDGQ